MNNKIKFIALISAVVFCIPVSSFAFTFKASGCGDTNFNGIYVQKGVYEFSGFPYYQTVTGYTLYKADPDNTWSLESYLPANEYHLGKYNTSGENQTATSTYLYTNGGGVPPACVVTDYDFKIFSGTLNISELPAQLGSAVISTGSSLWKVTALAVAVPLTFYAIMNILEVFPNGKKRKKNT